MKRMSNEMNKLSVEIGDLRKDVEIMKNSNTKSSNFSNIDLSERSSWDWASISRETILGTNSLIFLPTNTSRETLSPTIEALKHESKGATAEEISQITGRARNTESAYLRRLHLAGKVEKIRLGKKMRYKLV